VRVGHFGLFAHQQRTPGGSTLQGGPASVAGAGPGTAFPPASTPSSVLPFQYGVPKPAVVFRLVLTTARTVFGGGFGGRIDQNVTAAGIHILHACDQPSTIAGSGGQV